MTQQTDTSEDARIFGAEVADPDPGERYNIAPTQPVSVVLERDGRRLVETHRWGLIPAWADGPASGSPMINARAETVDRTPAYRVAFQRRRWSVWPDPLSGEWVEPPDWARLEPQVQQTLFG